MLPALYRKSVKYKYLKEEYRCKKNKYYSRICGNCIVCIDMADKGNVYTAREKGTTATGNAVPRT